MSLLDYEVFIRERLAVWNPTVDTASGSPLDNLVVQPLLRRLGTDPFTVDAATFIITRLRQEFPSLALGNGDSIEDLLVKPMLLLWDPFIREIQRIKEARSFSNPSTLTLEESEALGSTFFTGRNTGNTSKGPGRIYYAQPQSQNITSANFFTDKAGRHYFPVGNQAIRANEMALNKEGDLYYFDVDLVAEFPGDEYNIEPDSLSTVANVDAAVRVNNRVRFRGGLPAENSEEYVGRLQSSISEKSMVALRGITSTIGANIPEVTRMAVVGFNDPEMQRDVITGGGLGGPVLAAVDGAIIADGQYKPRSKRLQSTAVDFSNLGAIGPLSGYVLTVMGGLGPGAAPPIQDFEIERVVSQHEIDIKDTALFPGATNVPFTVRRRELTLSDIPGGILNPTGPNGTITIEPDKVHIGGMSDLYIRGIELEASTLFLDVVSDESNNVHGERLSVESTPDGPRALLHDLVLGTDYQVDDETYGLLSAAKEEQYSLEILEGPLAGVYRILDADLGGIGDKPMLWLDPALLLVSNTLEFRWRLVTEIRVNLVEPKTVRVAGTDGVCLQNQDTFTTGSNVDFEALGVAAGDILRIPNGTAAGDYTVKEVLTPGFTILRVDRQFTFSVTNTSYSVFRPNKDGGVTRPLVRVTSVDLLDTSGQPVGSKVPYAKPVDIQSFSFSNIGTGVKVSLADAVLGLVTQPGAPGFTVPAGTLALTWDGLAAPLSIALSGPYTASALVNALNAASTADSAVGVPIAVLLTGSGGTQRVGIVPVGPNTRTTASTAGVLTALFGDTLGRHSRDVRDGSSSPLDWSTIQPAIDPRLDVVALLDGRDIGFPGVSAVDPAYIRVDKDLSPDVNRSIRLGSRSFGEARLFFLDPTSITVNDTTWFSAVQENGISVRYRPDSVLSYPMVPAAPNGDKPTDGISTANTNGFHSDTVDFVRRGIRPGDELEIDFIPVVGTADIVDPMPGLALKNLRISLQGQPDKVVTFVNDVGSPGAVSRDGVADQINYTMGLEVCSVVEVGSQHFLKFDPTIELKIRSNSGDAASANTLLGFDTVTDTSNESPHAGTYVVTAVGSPTVHDITVSPSFPISPPGTIEDQQFRIARPGTQRITATQMATQVDETGLYYWDVELFSEGPGDLWNLPANTTMAAEGYKSDGYYLQTNDPNTTFSPYENVELRLSRSILEPGVDDDPENAVQLAGQSLSISYEHSPLVDFLQSFITSDVERVVCSNPLSRHLVPHFVRMQITYSGGAREADIQPDIERYISNTMPDQALESSDIQKFVTDQGATSIQNPINLVAVVHNTDRSITVARSQNALTTGRLAAFIPDRVKLVRRAR